MFRSIVLAFGDVQSHSVVRADGGVEEWLADFHATQPQHIRLSFHSTLISDCHTPILHDRLPMWRSLRRLDVDFRVVHAYSPIGNIEPLQHIQDSVVDSFSSLVSANKSSLQVLQWNVFGLTRLIPIAMLHSNLERLTLSCNTEEPFCIPTFVAYGQWSSLSVLRLVDAPLYIDTSVLSSLLEAFVLVGTPNLREFELDSLRKHVVGIQRFLEVNVNVSNLGLVFPSATMLYDGESIPPYPSVEVFRGTPFTVVQLLQFATPKLTTILYHASTHARPRTFQQQLVFQLSKLATSINRVFAPVLLRIEFFDISKAEILRRAWKKEQVDEVLQALHSIAELHIVAVMEKDIAVEEVFLQITPHDVFDLNL